MELSPDIKREIEKMVVKQFERAFDMASDQIKSAAASVCLQHDLVSAATVGLMASAANEHKSAEQNL